MMTELSWVEGDAGRSARWQSEAGVAPPKRVVIADDTMNADSAFRLASEGTALLWRGDFQNARQLLQALARRVDRKPRKPAATLRDAFNHGWNVTIDHETPTGKQNGVIIRVALTKDPPRPGPIFQPSEDEATA